MANNKIRRRLLEGEKTSGEPVEKSCRIPNPPGKLEKSARHRRKMKTINDKSMKLEEGPSKQKDVERVEWTDKNQKQENRKKNVRGMNRSSRQEG